MPSLAATFVAHGGRPIEGADAALAGAVARARRARPDLGIADEIFVTHLARHLGAEPDLTAALAATHVEDLYLACACVAGVAAALATLDADVLPRALAYVRKVDRRAEAVLDDVAQALRVRLLVREPGKEPAIASYAGRAPLDAWLRVAAVREARHVLRRVAGKREVAQVRDRSDTRQTGSPRSGSPERAYLQREGLASMGATLERVLRALDERERVLLRLYFVEGMSLANLGRIYHVHESTMARRVQTLRGRLLADVKRDLALDSANLESIVALVESQLDVHLSAVLRASK